MIADEDVHRHAVENLDQADALLFGRVTYEMMEAAWRLSTRTVAMPEWTEPFGALPVGHLQRHAELRQLDAQRPGLVDDRGDFGHRCRESAARRLDLLHGAVAR